jgi:hypothetical protein
VNGITNFLHVQHNAPSKPRFNGTHYRIFIAPEKFSLSKDTHYLETLYGTVLTQDTPSVQTRWIYSSKNRHRVSSKHSSSHSWEEFSKLLKNSAHNVIELQFFVLDSDLKQTGENLSKLLYGLKLTHFKIHVHIITKLSSQPPRIQDLNHIKRPRIELSLVSAISAAHAKDLRDTYHTPSLFLPLPLDESHFRFNDFNDKKDLIVISPEAHPHKKEVLKTLQKYLPHLKAEILQENIPKESYIEYLSLAKWAISLYGYRDSFSDYALQSGCLIFRPRCEFFQEESHYELETLYPTLGHMENKLIYDINRFSHPLRFALQQQVTQRYIKPLSDSHHTISAQQEALSRLLSLNFEYTFPFVNEVSVKDLPSIRLDEWASHYGRVS